MSIARDNHYVPQWYQRGFIPDGPNTLHYLDLKPDQKTLANGRVITMNSLNNWPTSRCFFQTDLYSTFFWASINDEIEKKLFGDIDNTGSRAVWAFVEDDVSKWQQHFHDFFEYMDIQKIRTPKGLDWIKSNYPSLTQNQLMQEMQALQNMHCTFWTEGVREIVSATNATTKFIISDHPVTIYNYALPPESAECTYPNDPAVALKGTQTLFPLDQNHCLILTNLEYAKAAKIQDPTQNRTNAKNFRDSMVRTDAFITSRTLGDEQVTQINFILKSRARKYIAAGQKEWLYPEANFKGDWEDIRETLLPPKDGLWNFGGEMYAGFKDGSSYYQDEYGRTTPENPYLKKELPRGKVRPNSLCGCGSGKKFKKCCSDKSVASRTSWEVLSIRERNMGFMDGVANVLGLNKGKSWEDVRRDLSNEQVKIVYKLFAFFWPIETEIFDLLPKPDGTARALYSGIVDPRTISTSALAMVPYFDEILIQNPMMNANAINKNFSPIEKPQMYKQEMLKQVLLLMQLMPFIEEGFVNFIPDPCTFDRYLQQQMFSMADARRDHFEINEKDKPLLEWMQRDEFERAAWSFPEDVRKAQIRRVEPDIDDEKMYNLLKYIEEKKSKDPFALLQDYEINDDQDGQMMMFNMTPNIEMSLYICQVTGAFLITDSHTRWGEFMQHQSRNHGMILSDWNPVIQFLNGLSFPFAYNPEKSFKMRKSGSLGSFRDAVQTLYSSTTKPLINGTLDIANKDIKRLFEVAHKQTHAHFAEHLEFEENMKFIIPRGGFTNTNVQRLLVSSGAKDFMNFAPMAILLDRVFPSKT